MKVDSRMVQRLAIGDGNKGVPGLIITGIYKRVLIKEMVRTAPPPPA